MRNTAHGLHMSDANSIQAHDQNVLRPQALHFAFHRVYICSIKLCLKVPYNEFRNQSVSQPNERFRPFAYNLKDLESICT